MRKIQIVGAFASVVVLSMMAVASASATLWLIGGASPVTEVGANSHGLVILEHKGGLIGNLKTHCTGLFVGSVGAGALGKIATIEGLKGELKTVECEFAEGGACGSTGAKVLVTAASIPWHTLLELVGSATVNHYLSETGKVLGYEVPCGSLGTDKCSGLELTLFKGNGSNGAIFEFNRLEKLSCADGGEATITGSLEYLGATVS